MRWYWIHFRRRLLPVTVRAMSEHHYLWSRIHGVQIGPWFIGVIKGDVDRSQP